MSIVLDTPPPKSKTLLVECMDHVLSYLRYNQLPTLVSLLRVNSTLFHLTIPVLYKNPFLIVRQHRTWSPQEKEARFVLLLKLFLFELDLALRDQLPPILEEEEDEEWNEAEDGYLNHQQNQHKPNEPLADQRDIKKSTPVLLRGEGGSRKYFYHYRNHDHSFLAQHAISAMFGSRINYLGALHLPSLYKAAAATTKVNRNGNTINTKMIQQKEDTDRSILSILDQLFIIHCDYRPLSICMSVLRVHQFRYALPFLSTLQGLDIQHIESISDEGDENLNTLVDWIQTHDRTFGTLRELSLGGSTEFDMFDLGTSKALVRIPQAFRKLTVLDTRSWSVGWSMIDQVTVEGLERLAMDYGEGRNSLNGPSLFTRCRALKVLDIFVPGLNTFKAVADLYKRQVLGIEVASLNSEGTMEAQPSGRWTEPPCLPPVERLYISGSHAPLKNALEDAAIGLSQTLRVLKATSTGRHNVQESTLSFGEPLFQLHMPFLHELQLQWDIALEFRFELLQCCPNLTTLRLLVNGLDSCGRPNNPLDPILGLRKLQVLQLMGRWPLTKEFVDQIPMQLTGLKILDLERCFGVGLNEVMEAVQSMEFLWRVGWILGEEFSEDEQLESFLALWKQKAPQIRVGAIGFSEFLT
ncbi:hypothetical protein EMPS_00360 [Entomortierella parvispora]|uniref:Uncharacterized protein n=1 Tax=Entomortierella parvispora TaxID=205924 RepID=A0A9P3H0N8_9FUNG|nr:hypothetical protein EMPS_00360 [Entomortierella parvispora]